MPKSPKVRSSESGAKVPVLSFSGGYLPSGKPCIDVEQVVESSIRAAINRANANMARILTVAVEAFDNKDLARRWLEEPNIQTGGKSPVSLIGTAKGFAAVESILRQIQYGVIG